MSIAKHLSLAVLVALSFSCTRAVAADAAKDEATLKAPAATADVSADEIAKLVEKLDAPRFADRQAASQRLAAIGAPAAPALGKAAIGQSREASTRAMDLLLKLLESSDEKAQEAAKTALEGVAKSDRPAAKRAKEALEPKPKVQEGGPMGMGQVIIGGGQLQIGVGTKTQWAMKNFNGGSDISIDDGNKKIHISEDPQKGIKIEVTEKKDGKDVTKKYEAKDVEELKKKQPEGYKIYKEHAEGQGIGGGMGMIQIQANAIPIGPGNMPQMPGNLPRIQIPMQINPQGQPVPMPAPGPAQGGTIITGTAKLAGDDNQIDVATAMIRALNLQLAPLAKDPQLKKAPQPAKDELKKQVEQLKEQLGTLERRLEGK